MADQIKPLTGAMPGERDSLLKAMSAVLQAQKLRFESLLPAQVVSFNRTTNVATVKPLITWITVEDTPISRKNLVNIPVISLGGGAFHISFPLNVGDLGWIWAADRDMSIYLSTLKESKPNTGRCHSFSDGMFIPDVLRQYTINAEDSGAMVIQSTSGATRISIRSDNIKITAPTKVTINTPTTEITGNVTIDQNLTVAGNTVVNGGFDATGSSGGATKLPANATVGGTNLTTHGHISSGAGSRTSGGMIT